MFVRIIRQSTGRGEQVRRAMSTSIVDEIEEVDVDFSKCLWKSVRSAHESTIEHHILRVN